MNFDDVLLALVSRRARSGYELKKWLDVEGIFFRANADQSQIYRTLRRLEKKRLITHETVRSKGPQAKVYEITPEGAAHLQQLARSPYTPAARWQEADFTARIALLGPIAPECIVDVIDCEIAFRTEQAREFRARAMDEAVESGLIDYDPGTLAAIIAELDRQGRAATDAWLEWLEGMRARWAARAGQSPEEPPTASRADANSSS